MPMTGYSADDLFYEVPSSIRPHWPTDDLKPSEPVPLARSREDSPLSRSTDSISSTRSSCSGRSAAERQLERESRRRLLDTSVSKLQGARDPPLRKHLHVYNTIKALQRDLELLDDEELFSTLTGGDQAMEMDEWPGRKQQLTPLQLHQEEPKEIVTAPSLPTVCDSDYWWSGSSSSNSGFVGLGSSYDDEPAGASSFGYWAHLDDLSANPLGHSWLSSGELSTLFAPNLASHSGDGLLLQA